MQTAAVMEQASVERHRPRLFGIAYRMLGDVQEAEDLVQETLLRWQRAGRAGVREPEGWLVTVVTRLAIDRLRAAKIVRAQYDGPWLPEPVAAESFSPSYRSELASDVSMAFLVMLEKLSPDERAALLLRDVFGCEYAEIAATLGKSQAAARQLVHRAREHARADRARAAVPAEAKARILGKFVRALHRADKDALLEMFSDDVAWTSDGGGKVTAARRVIHEPELIARMLSKLSRHYEQFFTRRLVAVNGEPAVLEWLSGRLFSATFCETDGERFSALYRVMNPDKLTHLPAS